uniref:Homeodomain-interacting protein kinase 1-like n=1 Tax=Stegastes partitus TaxID=144197 RepID=A0A3B5ASC6_9TELE
VLAPECSDPKYQRTKILGEGSFGVVAKCRNTENKKTVAIKVNKNEEGVLEMAIDEIAILKQLRRLDPDTCSSIVQWDGFFIDKERICITFELLDLSLHHYLHQHKGGRLAIDDMRPVLYQMATALSHLQSINIIHADVKPVNIMVVNRHQTPLQVKLIDFGVARIGSTVQQGDWMGTLSYSAPEMLLGVPYNECVDMWALGLVMAEVAVGCPLYPGDTDYDVFTSIVQTQGQPPDDVLDCGCYTDTLFNTQEYGRTRWTFKTPDDYNLIKSMLTLDARRRITAREVLKHQFFNSRSPAPNQSATSSQQRVDFSYQSPAPCQSATSWEERVDFSDQSPAPNRQPSTLTFTPTKSSANLNMFLECGRKLENPERIHAAPAWGENMQTPRRKIPGVFIRMQTGDLLVVRQRC